MTDITRTYRNFVTIFFSGREEPFVFELRRDDIDRLDDNIEQFTESATADWFFCCDTVDGKTVAINLATVQAIHCSWDPTPLPEDLKIHEGPVKIYLKNRANPAVIDSDIPEELHDLYFSLEAEPSAVKSFHKITNVDGEHFLINIGELQFIEASTHILTEGRKALSEDFDGDE